MYLCKRLKLIVDSEEELRNTIHLYTNLNPNNIELKPKSYFCLFGDHGVKYIYDEFFKQANHGKIVIISIIFYTHK